MPKKLIRDKTTKHMADWEWKSIGDMAELNSLYALKVKEELQEIEDGNWQDVTEFADLIQVAYDYALSNGFTYEEIDRALLDKFIEKGGFSNNVLTNMNPDNPSNKIYFK